TIRLFLFLAFQAVVLVKIPHPFAFAAPPFLALFSLSLQLMPPFLGENDLNMQLREAGAAELVSFLAILLIASYFQVALTRLHELHEKAKMQIEILNTTITKLTIFSQSLQSYARTAELEAAKKERYRISREIHDISGYMFTNIIAMMDAIVATGCRDCEKTSEMCSGARSQAQEGLVETRRALHLLRKSDQEREVGMKAIHKIKKIFEGTTGVQVEIESGNLPSSFGDEIDLILYRIVQEGLTNALRHGHATRVRMLFWIVDDSVQVIILDNGTGAKKIIKGIGLAGMEERISKLGGQVKAENAPEGGFQLTVTIPMQKELSDDTYSVG
ncbi:MAG: sensor histidine kinase, partial [Spirochaetia bacterium]|nr:sensor histidine kinase [Spirochaetia bacterium]